MGKNHNYNWEGLIELERGCPYTCTFCEVGDRHWTKVIKQDYDISISKINSKDIKFLESLYIKYLPRTFFNVFILSYLCGILNMHFIKYFNPILLENNTLETFKPIRAILEYCIALFLTEFTFYTCHRITHLPCLYKYIHKKHHDVKNCIGMAAG